MARDGGQGGTTLESLGFGPLKTAYIDMGTPIRNEKGEIVNGRGDKPNRHDILTGSGPDGSLLDGQTCNNWTSSTDGTAIVGHHDRVGGEQNPTSWNSAHATPGCGIEQLRRVGGEGYFYCFAAK